jgi:hypothetical protein
MKRKKKKKQAESGGDVHGRVNAQANSSARSLFNNGRSRGGEKSSQLSPGTMQIECNQIECKLVLSLVKPNTINQQSNELRTRSGAKELVALSIISAKQDQSNQRMPELGKEHVETVDGEKPLEREVQEQSRSPVSC